MLIETIISHVSIRGKVTQVARYTLVLLLAAGSATAHPQAHTRPSEPTAQEIQAAGSLPFRNPALPLKQRVEDLISRLTLIEKNYQLTDKADAIPRLGIPSYDWWNEGLHGIARSGYATMFPQAIGNAATWDAPLLHQIGTIVSIEARAKYNDALRHGNHDRYYGLTIWSPNINIFRDPRWGRGQETYGEDPFLTGHLGVAFIKGLQGDDPKYFRTIATPKHFAVHSGPEATRHQVNIDPSDHDLWDTYLPAFRAAITEGGADSIMCAYNSVDKVPACANKMLLQDILRRDWGFKGFVTSDCDAIDDLSREGGHHYAADHKYAAAAGLRAGTDTDCGFAYHAVPDAIQRGILKESELTLPLQNLFTARMRLGMFDPPAMVPFSSIPFSVVNSPEHQALALRAARESMVLLKNDHGFLPLRPGAKLTIAVVGPLATSRAALEGNYNAIPVNPVLPIDSMIAFFGGDHIRYVEGSPFVSGGYITVPRTILHPADNSSVQGLKAEYFADSSFVGSPSVTRIDKEIDFDWASANPIPSLSRDTTANRFAVRWTGVIAVPVAEKHTFQLHLPRCYPCDGRLSYAIYLDDKPLPRIPPATPVAVAKIGEATPLGPEPVPTDDAAPRFSWTFTDTQPHQLRIEYIQRDKVEGGGISFEWRPRHEMLQDEAVATVSKSDLVVAFVGLSPRLEGEEMTVNAHGFAGGDRISIDLPDVQEELIETLARKTRKPMIIVLLNGSAIALNWGEKNAKAILEAWYPGQAGGQAIAETLSGRNNPGGRLPVTFYTGTDQLPAFEDYSMANRTYRYFKGKPLYAFGDGLSYTSFAYSHLKLSTENLRAGDSLTVEADLLNTGAVAGDEVAELYLMPPKANVSPSVALSAFERVHLNAGEKRHIIFHLDPRTLSQIDAAGKRAVVAGQYRISLGGSQPDGDAAATSQIRNFSIYGNFGLTN